MMTLAQRYLVTLATEDARNAILAAQNDVCRRAAGRALQHLVRALEIEDSQRDGTDFEAPTRVVELPENGVA